GREASDPAPYWTATDTAGLEEALSSIVGEVVSCTLELSGQIVPERACTGTVRLGDEELMCNDSERGWRPIDSTHIELTGTACDDLQSSDAAVTARFP